ncbi:hypothetical protein CDO31_35990 (plasmid) [Sinorhizobium meliloti]|nr:hypothetical protein CDO31_35990 [Sinorhizobium meliloti]
MVLLIYYPERAPSRRASQPRGEIDYEQSNQVHAIHNETLLLSIIGLPAIWRRQLTVAFNCQNLTKKMRSYFVWRL